MEPRSDLPDLRVSYETAGIDADQLAADPLDQFNAWFAEARDGGVFEPNAMLLSTTSADGWPSARTVLLKGLDERGFVFYTNYTSDKSADLMATGKASLTFVWLDLHRQVRIVGPATKTPPAESDAYFASRPRGSRIGAWASDQSAAVPSRAALEATFAEVENRFGGDVPRPDHWGGWRIEPTTIEFWQGRSNRMHDRIRYHRTDTIDGWEKGRLAP